LARRLAERGHSITILTADLGLDSFKTSDPKFERCQWGWRLREGNIETIYFPTVARYRALTVNRLLIEFCRASLCQFDIAHFYGLYDLFGPTVSLWCRRRGVPYLVEPMGMFRPIDRAFLMKRLWHRSLGRTFLRRAARIVATSEIEEQELLEESIAQERLVVRYNGIDLDLAGLPCHRGAFRKKWKISDDETVVLFLSRLIPRKGADVLIEAFAKARAASARLVIAGPEGEPKYRSYLDRCAREFGVGDRVVFTGPLYDEEKRAALTDADLFVLPSRYENFANVAAEAIAFDVPVLVGDSCGIRSLVEGRAGLVVRTEQNAVAQGLRKMMEDKHLYQRLKNGCRQVAEELDWRFLSAQMESHYLRSCRQTAGGTLSNPAGL
jgi:glycosyltransferase involved in cell wall biosynthesis